MRFELYKNLITLYFVGELNSYNADEIDKEIRKIIDEAHDEAIKIIKERKDDVILIAETLLENETINEEQIDYLLKNRHLPTKEKVEEPKEEKPVEISENFPEVK